MKYRCESCLRLFSEAVMNDACSLCLLCDAAPNALTSRQRRERAPVAVGAHASAQNAPEASVCDLAPTAEAPPAFDAAHERCEKCFQLFPSITMVNVGGEQWCYKCRTGKTWYAVAVGGSDNKVKAAIRKSFDRKGLLGKLGKVMIPKHRTHKRTKNRFDVIDVNGKTVGQVSAADEAEAMFTAKAQFGKSRKKTVYKPEVRDDVLEKVVKTKEGRRVYWCAISDKGRLMGRGTGYRSEKHATEALTKIYGPKEKPSNPREQNVDPSEVDRVELAKTGGKLLIQNQKAMPGYLLVQCADDPLCWDAIRSTRGVRSVLPFSDVKKLEDLEDEEDLVTPTEVPVEQVEHVAALSNDAPPTLNYSVGDRVRVTAGTMTGMDGWVREIKGSEQCPSVRVELTLFGRSVMVDVVYTNLQKL